MNRKEYSEKFEFIYNEICLLAFCQDEDFKILQEKGFVYQLIEMLKFAESKLLNLKRFD